MKKTDYYKELLEAGKIPEGMSVDDYTYDALRVVYRDMRDTLTISEEVDYTEEGSESQTKVLEDMVEKSSRELDDVEQVGTTEWKLISMISKPRFGYKHIVRAMEYNGGVIMQFSESHGSSLFVSTINLPGERLIDDTDNTYKIQ